ncbi:M23 family metallopeptidase [Longitalea luteola]|uniref:M23 family metallopeptidase n=1 Tax=Longitalea luteola TaxID=2812563 RepID=UPI001A9670EC|nr:M23 family metallopeptidase [Longitalea luteola]
MHAVTLFCIVYMVALVSCHTSQPGLFGKRTPHEAYRNKLEKAGLENTRLGKLWIAAADKSLQNPVPVAIPYKETGYFEMNAPEAAGYIFSAKRGDRITVHVNTNPVTGILLFTELWEPRVNEQPKLLAAADTATGNISYEITKEGSYIVRIQPELLQGLAYTITISTTPSLAFPVHKSGDPRIISVWGADRDMGARRHEGIDIQAPRRTPTVAAANGIVTNVSENKLGGKVVFLRPAGKNYTLYYAHLDQQLVRSGQSVQVGDTIGLVGNTGNAKNTVPHLHFGIYTMDGAVDPLPFINPKREEPKEVRADTSYLTRYARLKANTVLQMQVPGVKTSQTNLPKGSLVKIQGAADQLYKVQLPDSTIGFIAGASITSDPLDKQRFSQVQPLLNRPDSNAAVKMPLPAGNTITLLGTYKDYYFVEWQDTQGWIRKGGNGQ